MNTDLFGFGAIEAEFWRTVFLMTRIMAALVAAPLFGAMAIPVLVRLAMSGAIAVFVATNSSVGVPPDMVSIAGCVALAGEILVGLSLGFLLQLAFAAPVIAAEIISGAMGMSMAMAADPNGGSQITAIGQFFTIAITLVFLGMDGHLVWLRLLIASYDAFPPGEAWLRPDQSLAIAAFASQTFNAALLIALPIAFVLVAGTGRYRHPQPLGPLAQPFCLGAAGRRPGGDCRTHHRGPGTLRAIGRSQG